MSSSHGSSSTVIDEWRDTVGRLTATSGAPFGLMSDSMAHALHATAQPVSRGTAAVNASEAADWPDWWAQRQRLHVGEVSVHALATEALSRLEQTHVSTAACVALLPETALAHARTLDKRLAAGERLGLLGGMPLAHKDLLHRAGKRPGYGMARAGVEAHSDATVLNRFDAADALHLATLHMTELAFDPSGTNAEAGHCLNPWSTTRIPGGSSSGSAAVVAARAVYGALGSDTGGSIRIPASLCGVTGLKPTFGLVSRRGAMSLSATHDHLGPIARSARDCALMLQAIAGFDVADGGSVPAPGSNDYIGLLSRPVSGLRVGVPQGYFSTGLHPRIQAVIQQTIASFEQMGVEVCAVPDFPYEDVNALAIMMIRAEATALYQALLQPQSKRSVGSFTRARLEEGTPIPAALYLQAMGLRGPLLTRFVTSVMADVDVLLAPVFPLPTPRVDAFDAMDADAKRLRGELTRLTRPINYLGLPSLALPGGVCPVEDEPGELPVGFQLIGRPYSESVLLQLGHAFQMATPWHLLAPPGAG